MLLYKDVVALEDGFIDLLQHIPGTKEEKQAHFAALGIRVPKANYGSIWEALTARLHHSGAASAVFEILRARMPPHLAQLLRQASRGESAVLNAGEPALVRDLFFQNGNLRRIGDLFLEHLQDRGLGLEKPPRSQPVAERRSRPYDIALSFAGEDRPLVDAVAHELKARGIKVFYDKFEEIDLLGKDLVAHLGDIYRNRAEYCAMFVSEHYVTKAWPQHERQHAQARALGQKREYILPIRLDDSIVPGLSPTIGYFDARDKNARDIARVLLRKLREHSR